MGSFNETRDGDDKLTTSDSEASGVSDTESEHENNGNISETESKNSLEEEESEDEVIKAIRRENEKQREHPPMIRCDEFIVDISFNPTSDLLAVGLITGDVILYKYSKEENAIVSNFELHTESCRDIEFNEDGNVLYSSGKDKTIMLSDVESTKLIRFYEDAHDDPIYCLSVLDKNLFATGDDNGRVKVWDLREKGNNAIFSFKRNEDYISDIITNENQNCLLCSSGDGSLTSIDLSNRKFLMQSEEYEEELTCLGLFRSETKLLSGTSKGKLLLFNWNEFGLHSDIFPGPKIGINDLIPITENIVVTACEDGNLRASHLFPHRHLGIVGQHELSIENVDICKDGTFIASSSHNNDIKFWNIQYFEDFEKVSHKHNKQEKRKEMEFNLPSSKRKNMSDFFSDLT